MWAQSWRGVVAAAVLAKLLVPVGYMPAALSEGGFMLCDGYLPAIDMPMSAGRMDSSAARGHSAHGAMHDSASTGTGHAPDDGQDRQHHWDHCPLGALATLAAIAPAGWQLPLHPAPSVRARETAREIFVPHTIVPFLSRAPPFIHS